MKCVVVLSGGMDSTTLLYDIKRDNEVVGVVSFHYNQRHKKELKFAAKTCQKLGLEHHIVDLKSLNPLLQGSSLTSKDIAVPVGHYAEENMKATVVPNRNMILLSVAVGYAVSKGANAVFCGVHAGDHDIYPDCRSAFIERLTACTEIANYTPVIVFAPYLNKDKGDIAKLGLDVGVPYEDTWTCYTGKTRPCLMCGACVERTEAFTKTGMKDPALSKKEWERAVVYFSSVKK